ncbi:hypothetical protein BGW80DRAFT_1463453 [Lactifluus volemus]|nr:hypothetical protein BGW80DRAFT_1463453 [Lactifluus volemus]
MRQDKVDTPLYCIFVGANAVTADTTPPAAAPPSTVPSQPVAVPADATAQRSRRSNTVTSRFWGLPDGHLLVCPHGCSSSSTSPPSFPESTRLSWEHSSPVCCSFPSQSNSFATPPLSRRTSQLLELKDEFNRAYEAGDKLAVQRIAPKQRSLYEESGISKLI